jgi:hypothetical protein
LNSDADDADWAKCQICIIRVLFLVTRLLAAQTEFANSISPVMLAALDKSA